MTTNACIHIDCAETAKLLRKALAKAFPGIKFSVRSSRYAGGASIDVTWLDGPTTTDVQAIAGTFAGGRFDGMIDMAYSVEHWLMPDGTSTAAHSPGTEGSRGTAPAFDHPAPASDAKRVQFGADYVHATRHFTGRAIKGAVERIAQAFGTIDPETVAIRENGIDAYIAQDIPVPSANEYLGTLVYRDLSTRDLRPAAAA